MSGNGRCRGKNKITKINRLGIGLRKVHKQIDGWSDRGGEDIKLGGNESTNVSFGKKDNG